MKHLADILLVAGWPVGLSIAQDQEKPAWPYRVEVFGNIAHGRFYNGDHLLGSGLDYGGGAGVRPFSGWWWRVGFEVQMARIKKGELENVGVSQVLESRLVMVNALYHFRSDTRVQPYVYGGVGHVSVDYTSRCFDCIFDQDPVTGKLVSRGVSEWHTVGSKTGVTLGGGVKIAINRHLSVRPELLLADTTPGSGWNWTWFRLQIGMGVHF